MNVTVGGRTTVSNVVQLMKAPYFNGYEITRQYDEYQGNTIPETSIIFNMCDGVRYCASTRDLQRTIESPFLHVSNGRMNDDFCISYEYKLHPERSLCRQSIGSGIV